MFKRTFVIILSGILLSTTLCIQSASAQTGRDTRLTEKTRATVQKLGVGREARVEVKLQDNTKLKGYVSAAEGGSFTVTDSKTGTSQTVAYTDVTQVKKPGGGLSTRALVIISAAAVAAVIVAVTVVKPVVCDGGAGC